MKRLAEALAPGRRAWVSTMAAESALLRDELAADPERARGVTFVAVQFPGIDRIDYLGFHPEARQWSCFMTPMLRAGAQQGRAELATLDYLALMRHFEDMEPVDVAIAQLTPPDAQGWCSPGAACDLLPLVWPRARRKIAHLNPRMPRTQGSFRIHVSELDGAITADRPLTDYVERPGGEIEKQIGAHVAGLVRDGDTLQFGIGSVPLALAGALRSHRKLRLHTGLVAEGLRTLWDAGALDRGARISTGGILGDAGFKEFAAQLPGLWLTDIRHTHDPLVVGTIPRFIAVNGAVEVDLFGQVNAERAGGAIQAGAGGLPAFALAAQRSPGGRLVICIPATARGGSITRIVPALGEQALVTLPRQLADTVVTEYGVAELCGRTPDARAQALIAIAAPSHRDALGNAWDAARRGL